MLTTLEVRTTQGTMLSLPLEDISDGIILANVKGLDPVKATLVSSSFAQMDGTQHHSSRRESRNIILTLELEADYVEDTVADLRYRMYDFFMPKSKIKLRFYTSDELIVEIEGRVETCETDIFSREPALKISIVCNNPDFLVLDTIEVEGDTVDDDTEFTIEYPGTVETGIVFVLDVDRDLTEFTIYHRAPDDSLRTLDFAANLEAGDTVTISTVVGSKSATLVRGGVQSSLAYSVAAQANWIQLEKGDNNLRVYAEGDPIPYTISYVTRYGGL